MSRKKGARRVLALAGAFLLGICSFVAVPNVAADDTNYDDPSPLYEKLVSAEPLPDNAELVLDYGGKQIHGEEDSFRVFMGEGSYEWFTEWENNLEQSGELPGEGTDEYYDLITTIYDRFGIFVYSDNNRLIDIYLRDIDTGEKIDYSGDGITISYQFGTMGDFEENFQEAKKHSSREWYRAVVHVKDDGTREYLPATKDDDGVWTFTTTSFSLFYPAYVAVEEEEEEAPKTLDATPIYIGTASVSVVSLFALGTWLGRKERR